MKEKSESELADKDLLQILEIEDNNICNDCGKKDPRWCSINNAVLLCSSCARTHKKFNEKVSKIKSLEVDPWTKEEIFFLKLGGNKKFTNLIKSYNIPLTKENQEYKYYTKAAEYHRNILLGQSKNNNTDNIIQPSLKEGIEILYKDEYSSLFNKYSNQQNISDNLEQINNNINSNNNIMNNSNPQINNNNSSSSWVNKIIDKISPDIDDRPININNNENKTKKFFDNIANNMLYAINDVKERAKDIDFKEKFRVAGEYVQNQTEKIQNSDTFKGIMNSVSSGIDTIIQKTDQFFKPENKSNINQINQAQNFYQQNNINNINNLNNLQINYNVQNNQNQNLNSNNKDILGNIVNKINEPKFQSNYSSINNDKNDQYNNYIKFNENANDNNNLNINKNKIEEIKPFQNITENNEKNKEDINIENLDNPENKEKNKEDNNVEILDNPENNEKNKDDNIESLDNVEDNNPNLLIMSNTPNTN